VPRQVFFVLSALTGLVPVVFLWMMMRLPKSDYIVQSRDTDSGSDSGSDSGR
jgi:hypothetical protein